MRDFFEHQAVAQRRTRALLLCMVLAVAALGSVLFALLACVRAVFVMRIPSSVQLPTYLQLWPLFAWSVGVTGALVALAGILRTMSLREGGSVLAAMLDARLVSGQPQDSLDRRLLNVVLEMALAAGTPVPQVYVLDREPGINALAAGWDLGDAVICVTRGCLHKLTRSELQGVVAHEFSHLLHGDARLNLRLMGAVYGMISIGLLGKQLMRGSNWSERRDGSLVLIGGSIAAIGALGGFLGNLIKAAVSRQREYLADAAAVQYTRDPESIARALKKIGGFVLGSRLSSVRAEELEHFFFEETSASTSWAWLTTHPPLHDRILRLEPGFDGTFITPVEGLAEGFELSTAAANQQTETQLRAAKLVQRAAQLPALNRDTAGTGDPHDAAAGRSSLRASQPRAADGGDAAHADDRSQGATQPLTAASDGAGEPASRRGQPASQRLASAGDVDATHRSQGATQPLPAAGIGRDAAARLTAADVVPLIGTSRSEPAPAELPAALREACDNPFSACGLVLALLVSADKTVAQRQARQLRELAGTALLAEAQRLHSCLERTTRSSRLTLAMLAAPSLRALSRDQKQLLQRCVDALIAEDGAMSIFELAISFVTQHWQEPRPYRLKRSAGLSACREAVALVLSCLAHTGAAFDDAADSAFREACARLPGLTLRLLPQHPRLLSGFTTALEELQALRPTARAALIEACAYAVLADARVTADELTLLRALCLALDAPLPPLEDAASMTAASSAGASRSVAATSL